MYTRGGRGTLSGREGFIAQQPLCIESRHVKGFEHGHSSLKNRLVIAMHVTAVDEINGVGLHRCCNLSNTPHDTFNGHPF